MRLAWEGFSLDADGFAVLEARAVQALEHAGLRAGHHVGLLSGTSPLAVAVIAACRTMRLVVVPFAPELLDDVVAAQARHADLDAFVAAADHAQRARGVAHRLGVSCLVAHADGTAWQRPVGPSPGALRARDAELAAILHTSGTTQAPRAWALRRLGVERHVERAIERIQLAEDSVVLASLPLSLVGGFALVQRALRLGHALVLLPRFDAPRALRLMAVHRVTHASLVPLMLQRLLDASQTAPRTLRSVLLGGDAAPRDLLLHAWEAGWPVQPTYGLTEAGSQVATASIEEARARPGTVGLPLAGVEVEICDDAGVPVPADTTGSVFVRGDALAVAYPAWREGESAPARVDSGDLGHLDRDGFLFVTGRRVERIVTGGRTVAARDVEQVLATCPGVAAVCVVGVRDAQWGERVVAAVEPVAGATLAPDTVAVFARARLQPHERPRDVRVLPRLPRTALGKLDRGAVAAMMLARYGATLPT